MERRIKAGLSLAAALGVLLSGPQAHAATRLVANDYPSVYGSADVTFAGRHRVEPINNVIAKDTACDGNAVYVRFIVYLRGSQWKTGERRNAGGCGTTREWDGLYINDTFNDILGVRLEACVDSIGSDECDTSSYADNPYTA